MRTRWVPLLSLWIATAFRMATAAEPLPDYIRFSENERNAQLQVAIRSFAMPSGQRVDLIGVVHIADDAYYQELNRRFTGYDSVLFELVGDPENLTREAPLPADQRNPQSGGSGLSSFQLAAARYLDLTFQLGAIDYTGKNMVHADASMEQFAQMQAERGENTLTLFARAMQAQMGGQMNRAAMNELDTFGLIRILMSADSAAEFKKSLAKMFDQMESMTAAMEGDNPSAILGGRNDLVLEKIREVLARQKQRRIAVFYGAAHLPGIELALKQSGASASGEEWLPAWTMPKKSAVKPTTPRAGTNPVP
jgi:hypothetical protein